MSNSVQQVYPLLAEAQRLGAPIKVSEPDADGDVSLDIFDGDGNNIISGYIFSDEGIGLERRYIIMGVLTDWLTMLEREDSCLFCDEVKQAMTEDWADGGFTTMLMAFVDGVKRRNINNCAQRVAKRRVTNSVDVEAELERYRDGLERIGELVKDALGGTR